MGKRDAFKSLARGVLGLVTPRREAPPEAPVYRPPVAEAPKVEARVESGDLWAVRYAVEPQQGRPRLVNHWATWCDPCLEELPLLVALQRRVGERVDFVGVGWELFSSAEGPDGAKLAVEAVCDEHGVPWRTVMYTGEPKDLFEALQLESELIPQTFLLDGEGRVRFHHVGALTGAQIDQIEAAIREISGPGK